MTGASRAIVTHVTGRNILHIMSMLASIVNFPRVHLACILLMMRIESSQFAMHSQITHEFRQISRATVLEHACECQV